VRRLRLPTPPLSEPRAVLETLVEYRGQQVRLWSVHLSPGARLRHAQVRALALRVGRSSGPLILAGDVNAPPDGEDLCLLHEAGLFDLCSGEVMTFPCHAPSCRLDYILVSRHFEVTGCRAVDTQVSDHLPLVADLVLR
jgi:endonuclease/exonuclease/phosphatase family metal-dependent hydrolase